MCERGQYHSPISSSSSPGLTAGRASNLCHRFRDAIPSDVNFQLRTLQCCVVSSRLGAPIVSLLAHSLHPHGCHLARYSVGAGAQGKRVRRTTNGRTSHVVVSDKFHGKKVATFIRAFPPRRPSLPIRSFATTVIFRRLRAPCKIGVARARAFRPLVLGRARGVGCDGVEVSSV